MAMEKAKFIISSRLFFQLFPQGRAQVLIAGFTQESEHVLLICLHAGLVKGVYIQQIAGQAAGIA